MASPSSLGSREKAPADFTDIKMMQTESHQGKSLHIANSSAQVYQKAECLDQKESKNQYDARIQSVRMMSSLSPAPLNKIVSTSQYLKHFKHISDEAFVVFKHYYLDFWLVLILTFG